MEFIKKQRNLTKEQARWLFQQLIVGLNYCHKMGINNRGVGLEHSLLDGHASWPLLKISGFYYSKVSFVVEEFVSYEHSGETRF